MREGARFVGYALEGNLVRVDEEVTAALRARAGAGRVFLVTYEDASRHGDTRLLVAALSPGRSVATHRFNGRDPLLLREFAKILD